MMSKSLVAGVDEAGRGPLIGDLFMAMVVVDLENEDKLRLLGVRDSKKLNRKRREELFGSILSLAELVIVARIPPAEIDSENLNTLEVKSLCKLISKAYSIIGIDRVYVDSFANPDRIKAYLSRCLEESKMRDIVIEHRADSLYTVVGAASIVAKVLRDRHIDVLRSIYGDFGSGYPSDRRTVDWLKDYYQKYRELPPIVRRSWKTVENALCNLYTLDKYLMRGY